jgi:hypothetical protein
MFLKFKISYILNALYEVHGTNQDGRCACIKEITGDGTNFEALGYGRNIPKNA